MPFDGLLALAPIKKSQQHAKRNGRPVPKSPGVDIAISDESRGDARGKFRLSPFIPWVVTVAAGGRNFVEISR